jgi:hypothetical protein
MDYSLSTVPAAVVDTVTDVRTRTRSKRANRAYGYFPRFVALAVAALPVDAFVVALVVVVARLLLAVPVVFDALAAFTAFVALAAFTGERVGFGAPASACTRTVVLRRPSTTASPRATSPE